MILLFSSTQAELRDLPSFPTRRSSNLRSQPLTEPDGRIMRLLLCPRQSRAEQRSEEHTSELQSHSDIVCRLLLEKKNGYGSQDVPVIQARWAVGITKLGRSHAARRRPV